VSVLLRRSNGVVMGIVAMQSDSRKRSCIHRAERRADRFSVVNTGALETLAATRNELGAEDRASGLADVMRAAGRASHIHDTRRADVEQEASSRRACDSLLAIRHF
jgi:hypothetical protein